MLKNRVANAKKIDVSIEMLRKRHMTIKRTYPWSYRLLRKCGIALRPPAFSSFTAIALGFGTYFTLAWGAILNLVYDHSLKVLSVVSPIAGAAFGLWMAIHYRKERQGLKLPKWEEIKVNSCDVEVN